MDELESGPLNSQGRAYCVGRKRQTNGKLRPFSNHLRFPNFSTHHTHTEHSMTKAPEYSNTVLVSKLAMSLRNKWSTLVTKTTLERNTTLASTLPLSEDVCFLSIRIRLPPCHKTTLQFSPSFRLSNSLYRCFLLPPSHFRSCILLTRVLV